MRHLLALALLLSPTLAEKTCEDDPEALVAEADRFLKDVPGEDGVAIARDFYRRARIQSPSLFLSLKGADLAFLAGDEDDTNRLLEGAARLAGELLSPLERLSLARQAEARGDRRGAILQYGHALAALQRRHQSAPAWIGERIRRLDVEEEAKTLRIRPGAPAPTAEAQAAFQQGKADLDQHRADAARELFRRALRLSPGYVEAALALGGLEARAGRTEDAAAAWRTALAADPDRFEAVLSLANLLWAEPDRQAKEESLALLDRALALKPDATRLWKEAAERWATWGDAGRALERLEAYRSRAPAADRPATDTLWERLKGRVSHPGTPGTPTLPELVSQALGPYGLAQVYVRRGDEGSLAAALELLDEAVRADRRFVPALELMASVQERRGQPAKAEEALRRAAAADPTRATTWERLADLVARQPERTAEALDLWEKAEAAGSREAIFQLARAATAMGERSRAESLWRRTLDEMPEGPHADEARAALVSARRRERLWQTGGGAALGLAAVAGAAYLYRRRAGLTLAEWLAKEPSQVREIRPAVGRLRHEALKHGGLLLKDASSRLAGSDSERRDAAALLRARLFGTKEGGERGDGGNEEKREQRGGRGLVEEARAAIAEIEAVARRRGRTLNLTYKDPLIGPIEDALNLLARNGPALLTFEEDPGGLSPRRLSSLTRDLERAAAVLSAATGHKLGRLLDDASSTDVRLADLEELLKSAAKEAGVAAPPLQPLGVLASGGALTVRMPREDWTTLWRNLFANAAGAPALALLAEERRDAVTGQALAHFVLADGDPRPLTAEMIRGRAAERGLGLVADLVRRWDGFVDVGPPPAGAKGCVKGILLEFPARESAPT